MQCDDSVREREREGCDDSVTEREGGREGGRGVQKEIRERGREREVEAVRREGIHVLHRITRLLSIVSHIQLSDTMPHSPLTMSPTCQDICFPYTYHTSPPHKHHISSYDIVLHHITSHYIVLHHIISHFFSFHHISIIIGDSYRVSLIHVHVSEQLRALDAAPLQPIFEQLDGAMEEDRRGEERE